MEYQTEGDASKKIISDPRRVSLAKDLQSGTYVRKADGTYGEVKSVTSFTAFLPTIDGKIVK